MVVMEGGTANALRKRFGQEVGGRQPGFQGVQGMFDCASADKRPAGQPFTFNIPVEWLAYLMEALRVSLAGKRPKGAAAGTAAKTPARKGAEKAADALKPVPSKNARRKSSK